MRKPSKVQPWVDAEKHLPGIEGAGQAVQAIVFFLTADEPTRGAFTRLLGIRLRRGILYTFVERHGDGGTEMGLDSHAFLGTDKQAAAVHMGSEGHAFLSDFAQTCEGKHLKSAAISQNRPSPSGEGVEPAEVPNQLIPRPDMQVIGIAELYLAFQIREIVGGHGPFDSAASRDIHKTRRLHRAVRCFKPAAAGLSRLCEYFHKASLMDFPILQTVYRILRPASSTPGGINPLKGRGRQ